MSLANGPSQSGQWIPREPPTPPGVVFHGSQATVLVVDGVIEEEPFNPLVKVFPFPSAADAVVGDDVSKAFISLLSEHLSQLKSSERSVQEQFAVASRALGDGHQRAVDALTKKAMLIADTLAGGNSGCLLATEGKGEVKPKFPKTTHEKIVSFNLRTAAASAAKDDPGSPLASSPPATPRPTSGDHAGSAQHTTFFDDLSFSKEARRRCSINAKALVHESHESHEEVGFLAGKLRKVNKDHMMTNHMVFADAESMKDRVREAVMHKPYKVQDCYRESGIARAIAMSSAFDFATLTVIGLNAIWIGIDTDHNNADSIVDADVIFQVVENLFCAFFAFEIIVRTLAFQDIRNAFKDSWYVFDLTLAFMMVTETWVIFSIVKIQSGGSSEGGAAFGNASILKLLRLLRLSRVARMIRLMRAVPELMILVKGISVATRSVFFTLCLLMIFMYVFGLSFVQLTKGTRIHSIYFKSVLTAMNTLLLHGTFLEECPTVINMVGDESPWLRLLFLLYVLLASLTVMNMLVGVLCEVVSVVSSVEKEAMQVNYVKERLVQILSGMKIDAEHNGNISREEFVALLETPEAARALRDVGVDVVGLVDYHDILFKEEGEFDFLDLLEIVLSLRGAQSATVKDIVDLRKFLMQEMTKMEINIENIKIAVRQGAQELQLNSENQQHHNSAPAWGASVENQFLEIPDLQWLDEEV